MAKVIIPEYLESQINKKFKGESVDIFELMYSLEENPHKGKPLGNVAGIVIKELKYKKFRFYFLVDGFKLKVLSKDGLTDLLMKFVRMSNKKAQQKTISQKFADCESLHSKHVVSPCGVVFEKKKISKTTYEIRNILITIGAGGF